MFGKSKVEPTPFGSKRAEEIWENRGHCWDLRLTPGEDAYVHKVWDTMPGHTCWMDAFFRILNGPEESC